MLSLNKSLLVRPVFCFLLEEILNVCPQLRRQLFAEMKAIEYIRRFMIETNDSIQMIKNFRVPPELYPIVFPTEPTLMIEDLKIIDSFINNSRKKCQFMVSHDKPEYTVQFVAVYEEERCFSSKGFSVRAGLLRLSGSSTRL